MLSHQELFQKHRRAEQLLSIGLEDQYILFSLAISIYAHLLPFAPKVEIHYYTHVKCGRMNVEKSTLLNRVDEVPLNLNELINAVC